MAAIRRVFDDYCAGNKQGMDGKHFAKLARDSNLLDGKLTPTEMDLTFSKIKDRTQRRITFDQFEDGIAIIAKKKGVSIKEVREVLEQNQGRILYGTVAEPNKFHDDKSLYTGVYANGGPTNIDTDKITDISQLMDRSPADVRGVKKDGIGTYNDWGGSFKKKKLEMESKRGVDSRMSTAASAPATDKPELRKVFRYYCETGKNVMDSFRLAKLTRDCKILDSQLTPTDVDLFFVKAKNREEKRISYEQFLVILSMMAAKKEVPTSEIEAVIAKSEGPILYGTIAEPNKYHDDKNYYTGVHAYGGPSIIEDHKITDLSQLMDRTPADARGVKEKTKAAGAWGLIRGMAQDASGVGQNVLRNAGLRMMSMRQIAAPGMAVSDSKELQKVYELYCVGEAGMRGSLLAQLIKDTRLVDNKNLTPLDVDYIFNKVKAPGERRLGFAQFLEVLQLLSQKKKIHMEALVARVEGAPGPPEDRPATNRTDISASSPKKQSALLQILNSGPGGIERSQSLTTPRPRSKEVLQTVSSTVEFWRKTKDANAGVLPTPTSTELERKRAEVEAARRRVEEVQRIVDERKAREAEAERKREEERRLDAELERMRLADMEAMARERTEAEEQSGGGAAAGTQREEEEERLAVFAEEEEEGVLSEEEEEEAAAAAGRVDQEEEEEEGRGAEQRAASAEPAEEEQQAVQPHTEEAEAEEEEAAAVAGAGAGEGSYDNDFEAPSASPEPQPRSRPLSRHDAPAAPAQPEPEAAAPAGRSSSSSSSSPAAPPVHSEPSDPRATLSPSPRPASPPAADSTPPPAPAPAPAPAAPVEEPAPVFGRRAGAAPSVFRFKPSGSFKPSNPAPPAPAPPAPAPEPQPAAQGGSEAAAAVAAAPAKSAAEEALEAKLAAHQLPADVAEALREHGVRSVGDLLLVDAHDVEAMQAQANCPLRPIQAKRLRHLVASNWTSSKPPSPPPATQAPAPAPAPAPRPASAEKPPEDKDEAAEDKDEEEEEEEKEEEPKVPRRRRGDWEQDDDGIDLNEDEMEYFEI